MPPAYKFTKDEMIRTALNLAREEGIGAVTARAVGQRLGASSKVIFGSFAHMEELHREVIRAARDFHASVMASAMEQALREGTCPPYKASGLAYIRFAREEPNLFRLLFMRDRTGETVNEAEERAQCRPIVDMIMAQTGLDEDSAYRFHVEMWIFVHGMAAMVATGYLEWDEAFVSQALTDAYLGLRHQFTGG